MLYMLHIFHTIRPSPERIRFVFGQILKCCDSQAITRKGRKSSQREICCLHTEEKHTIPSCEGVWLEGKKHLGDLYDEEDTAI